VYLQDFSIEASIDKPVKRAMCCRIFSTVCCYPKASTKRMKLELVQ
jgi:hypothetical protein